MQVQCVAYFKERDQQSKLIIYPQILRANNTLTSLLSIKINITNSGISVTAYPLTLFAYTISKKLWVIFQGSLNFFYFMEII